jgi:molybdenum cofactor biosynthesis enzyme MoaA
MKIERERRLPRAGSKSLRTRWLERFKRFNAEGGKFRLAVINACNLDCFFCHNEAMPNPRRGKGKRGKAKDALGVSNLVAIATSYARLGGKQINVTGGEPLAHPRFLEILDRIERPRGPDGERTRLVLNSNVVLADRLLKHPRHEAIDGILASLHTTDDEHYRSRLGGRGSSPVKENIVALTRHGYNVEIGYSLGPYNRDEFPRVLDFALETGISLKAIALVRSKHPQLAPDFYGGDWVDPLWLEELILSRGGREVARARALGGATTTYDVAGTKVKIKNVARGRLRTDFCDGCAHEHACGEGIYALRVGVDGRWKPCLLRSERYVSVDSEAPYDEQILRAIDAMVGNWDRAHFATGAPA